MLVFHDKPHHLTYYIIECGNVGMRVREMESVTIVRYIHSLKINVTSKMNQNVGETFAFPSHCVGKQSTEMNSKMANKGRKQMRANKKKITNDIIQRNCAHFQQE